MKLRGMAAAMALLAAGASASAADKVTGRWAADADGCAAYFFSANAPLVVSDSSVRWRGDSCRIARMYKTGQDVHIQAMCWNADGERSVPVSLRPHGEKLLLRWDRVAAGDLKRCD